MNIADVTQKALAVALSGGAGLTQGIAYSLFLNAVYKAAPLWVTIIVALYCGVILFGSWNALHELNCDVLRIFSPPFGKE